MLIGVPKEIKTREYRVGLVPGGVQALTSRGHTVLVEKGAGIGSGRKASRSARSTRARFPSSTGTSPPSSRRASSTWPEARTVRKPKSERKSRGKTVR